MVSEIKSDKLLNQSGDQDSGIDLSTNDVVKVNIAGAEKARVDSSVVLIGKTANTFADEGIMMSHATGEVNITRDGGVPLYIRRDSSDGNMLVFYKDGTSVGVIGSLSGTDLFIAGERGAGLRLTDQEFFPVNESGSTNDNAIDLGHSVGRFDDIYATNSTINTSDENEKQNIASFTTKELAVATKLSALFKTFKWKDKVAEKAEKARTHSGIVAQQVKTAFASEGLDLSLIHI